MSETTGRRQGALASALQPLGDAVSLLVVTFGVVIMVAVAADVVGLKPLAYGAASVAVIVGVAVVIVALGLLMRREGHQRGGSEPPHRWMLRVVVAAPSLVLVGYALVAFLLPTSARVEWFVNGDNVRHLVLVADERARGALSYEIRPYPRGWHTSVALLWSALGGPGNPPQLAGLIDLMSTCAWLLSAALALATATLGAAVGTRVGLRPMAACVAAAVAAFVTLWPSFLGDYQALGLESSLVAAVVLAVCLRELLERLGSLSAFLVGASGLVVMGHTWQLLLPFSGLAALVSGWSYARGGPARRWVVVLIGAAVSVLSILPSFAAVATQVGVGHAVVADVAVPVPVVLTVAGVAASLGLAWWRRSDRALVGVLVLVCLPAVTGVVLALRLGISPLTYYPGKLLWHTAALGLAVVAAVLALAWQRLGERPSLGATFGRVLIGATAVLTVLASVIFPSGAFRGSWSTADAHTVLALLATPGADRAQVVWTDGPLLTDDVTRILLDAYRPEVGRIDTPQGPQTVEQECALLAAAAHPAILTTMPEAQVRSRYACAPEAEILRP